jgi:hypothetical protein
MLDNIKIVDLDTNPIQYNTQFGENGHLEYGWSNNIQEKIVQLNFQLTRTGDNGKNIQNHLSEMLCKLKFVMGCGSVSDKEIAKGYLTMLYKMIGHTRDIISGKGEYALTYMMIYTWYKYYPTLAEFALNCLVSLNNDNTSIHPYGSWKDIKYFCSYCADMSSNRDHPLILTAIRITNNQLLKDSINSIDSFTISQISLAAKWVPREKSNYSWLYQSLAKDYYKKIMITANKDESVEKAIKKCKTEYRKLLSSLNRKLDTLQIRQCGKIWSTIEFNKVTSNSMIKQKTAFRNINKNGEIRYPDDIDRIKCALNFENYIKRVIDGKMVAKGKRIGMVDFTKQALNIINASNTSNTSNASNIERELLNAQWINNSSQNDSLGKMIAMVDVSGSMDGDPLYAAIALGLRIAEKSAIGKRVLTFSSSPKWVNLDKCTDDFVSQVEILKNADWGYNTNFYNALNMILDSIIENKMSPEDVQDMVLVILSDMQIDEGDVCDKKALYTKIKEKYEVAGIRVHGKGFKPPHILFWNLRSTSGFPNLSNEANTSMMSGFSPVLLNSFCEQCITSLQICTTWSHLEKTLENDRYKILGYKLNEMVN